MSPRRNNRKKPRQATKTETKEVRYYCPGCGVEISKNQDACTSCKPNQ